MSFGSVHSLTANGDWLDMIWPIALIAIYGVGAIVKSVAGRAKDNREEAEEPSPAAAEQRSAGLRYKPLDESAGPRPETPQSRTLPYARTAGRSEPASRPPAPAAQPAEVMSQWDRQQETKRRRQEQIEALRRQQQQQQQQQRQQQILQQQRQQQQAAAQRVRSQGAPSGGTGPQAVRKAPQEARRQVQSARSAAASALSRHSVLTKGPAAAARTALQAAGAMPPAASGADRLRGMLRSRDNLRTAMVLREILDKPLAMRE